MKSRRRTRPSHSPPNSTRTRAAATTRTALTHKRKSPRSRIESQRSSHRFPALFIHFHSGQRRTRNPFPRIATRKEVYREQKANGNTNHRGNIHHSTDHRRTKG